MTTAGMIAEVIAIEDDAVVLEIAPGVEVRFVKQAIGQVLHDDEEIEDETEGEEPEEAAEPAEAAEAEHKETPEARETLQDDVEAKTETLPGATGKKSEDTPLNEDEDKSGKRPSA
jgi:Preprotein translocase subunit YajC